MSFYKETICSPCKPFSCKVSCAIGEELRGKVKSSKCKDACVWMEQSINGINICKDPVCPVGEAIDIFRKKDGLLLAKN